MEALQSLLPSKILFWNDSASGQTTSLRNTTDREVGSTDEIHSPVKESSEELEGDDTAAGAVAYGYQDGAVNEMSEVQKRSGEDGVRYRDPRNDHSRSDEKLLDNIH